MARLESPKRTSFYNAVNDGITETSKSTQPYEGLPLPNSSEWIRLLDIDAPLPPESESGLARITGRLRTAHIHSAPSFVSISYVWGPVGPNKRVIELSGQQGGVEITENCYQALWHIQQQFGSLTIWVDSICINQQDEHEKEEQIPLMRQIYSMAQSVYIWLGPGSDATDSAIRHLRKRVKLGRRIPLTLISSKDPKLRKCKAQRFRYGSWKDMIDRFTWSVKAPNTIELDTLLDQEWIHRLWTLQECCLATNLTIICGNQAISWEEFVVAVCVEPEKFGFFIPCPASEIVLENWRSVIDLWLNIPRPQCSEASEKSEKSSSSSHVQSFREKIVTFAETQEIPLSMRVFHFLTGSLLVLSMLGLWGFTTYKAMMSAKKTLSQYQPAQPDKDFERGKIFFLIICFWIFPTMFVAAVTVRMYFRLHFINLGASHAWLLKKEFEGTHLKLLDAIRVALRVRDGFNLHDKSYALDGILRACGANPCNPDYSRSVGQTYRTFVEDLLAWSPHALIMIIDAGGKTDSDCPSWVPNWQYPLQNQWLAARYRLDTSFETDKITNKIVYKRCYRQELTPSFQLSNCKLCLHGNQVGTVIFLTKLVDGDNESDEIQRKRCILQLLRWISYITEPTQGVWPYYGLLSSLFAVLEGLTPRHDRRDPAKYEYKASTKAKSETIELNYPIVQDSDDFSDITVNFDAWISLYNIFCKFVCAQSVDLNPDTDDHLVADLVEAIKADESAFIYCNRINKLLRKDQRCLFVVSSGNVHPKSFVGSGPQGVKRGDDIIWLRGIPVPMVLRQKLDTEESEVVGPALVHGAMHNEKSWLRETGMSRYLLV